MILIDIFEWIILILRSILNEVWGFALLIGGFDLYILMIYFDLKMLMKYCKISKIPHDLSGKKLVYMQTVDWGL